MSHASRAGHKQQAGLFGARRVSSGALPTEPTPVASLLSRSAERQRNPDVCAAAGRVRGLCGRDGRARSSRRSRARGRCPPLAALVAAAEALEGMREEAPRSPGPRPPRAAPRCRSRPRRTRDRAGAVAEGVVDDVGERLLEPQAVGRTTSGSPGATDDHPRPVACGSARRRLEDVLTSTGSGLRRSPPWSARASRSRSSAIRARRSVASAATDRARALSGVRARRARARARSSAARAAFAARGSRRRRSAAPARGRPRCGRASR